MSSEKLTDRLLIGLTLPLIILNGWVVYTVFKFFQPLGNIVIAAAIVAFLLNYAVQFLTKRGVGRSGAVLVVFLVAATSIIAVSVTLFPLALGQLSELGKRLPSWVDSGVQQLQSLQDWAEAKNIKVDISGIITQLTNRLSDQLQNLSGRIIGFLLDTAGSLLNVALTLVLTFYLLLQGDRIWHGIFNLVPDPIGTELRQSLRQKFKNYYIGQATLALMSGTAVTITFISLHVPFGLLFGMGIGIMTLVPFGSWLAICLIALIVALEDFWLGIKVFSVGLTIDQIVTNVIAPRLLGNLTGLNPVWILVALIVGLKINGPLGLIIAVPVAGSIRTILDLVFKPELELERSPEEIAETVLST
jgi:predicted PurR-regulated permease PerM